MVRVRTILLAVPILASLVSAAPVPQDREKKDAGTKATEAMGAKSGKTADNQSEKSRDRETTRQIRKAVIKDDALSMAAHNVKIVTRGGKVTLKGRVNSEEEKKAVESKATEVAGAGNVTNDLTVAAGAKGDKAAAKQERSRNRKDKTEDKNEKQ